MVPRLIFAALVFCSLASRPGGARHRPAPEANAPQAQPAIGPATAGTTARR